MSKLNREEPIPIEAAVKYIVRDRDGYKAKLDQLIPYTKRLEARVKEMEQQLDIVSLADIKEMEKTIDRLTRENKRLTEENTNLIFDYHQSEWFKGMQRQHQKRQGTIKNLRISLNEAIIKLAEYEGK